MEEKMHRGSSLCVFFSDCCCVIKSILSGNVTIYEKNISFCTGCRACVNTKTCIQKDDIQEIVVHLQECQSVFLAVPFSWIFGQSRGQSETWMNFFGQQA